MDHHTACILQCAGHCKVSNTKYIEFKDTHCSMMIVLIVLDGVAIQSGNKFIIHNYTLNETPLS